MKLATGPATVSTPTGTGDGAIATVTAVIATIAPGVVDHDGDAYDPGAFAGSGQILISQWNHASMVSGGAMPVGVGTIREVGRHAIFEGMLWLAMAAARDVYEVLRQRGSAQEWSYGYEVTKSRPPGRGDGGARQVIQQLSAYEASPVWRGAGIGTRTTSVTASGDALDAATQEQLRRILAAVRGRKSAAETAASLQLIRIWAERREAARR